MDLAYYLSEILGLQGEVNVPGLGYFVKVRVNGHYNDEEGKFYPPYNDIQFDRQSIDDDDTLAKYISDKKKISLASSKYFTEKYVSTILSEAMVKEAELGNLGWLSTEGSRIIFRPKLDPNNDAAFFGLPALQVYKLGQQPIPNRHIPDLSLTIAPEANQPEPVEAAPEAVIEEEEYVDEKRGISVWLIILIIIGILGLATAGLYLYKPALFATAEQQLKPLPPVLKPEVYDTPDTLKKDTAVKKVPLPVKDSVNKAAAIKKDTIAKVKPADDRDKIAIGKLSVVTAKPGATKPTASTKPADPEDERPASTIINDDTRNHYEIIGGSFKTLTMANKAMAQFKGRGIDARIITYGKWNKITLGSFYVRGDAVKTQKALELTGKLRKNETIIEEIKK
jgi:hypothetical protein